MHAWPNEQETTFNKEYHEDIAMYVYEEKHSLTMCTRYQVDRFVCQNTGRGGIRPLESSTWYTLKKS